jgi:putative tryptophan/tyrosine transport system substrate-binding protein
MRRRDFIAGIVGSATVWPLAARAQQPVLPIIGFLYAASIAQITKQMVGFREGLGESGYVEGQNVAIEYRAAEGRYDMLPALAAELVRLRVAVIVAGGGSESAHAAKIATADIPILFNVGSDPVKAGLVESFNRPGGNVTGVSITFTALLGKLLDVLHQLIPNAAVIGALLNPNYPDADGQTRLLEAAAETIKQPIKIIEAGTERAIDAAFSKFAEQKSSAVLVASDPYFAGRSDQIIMLAAHYGLPTIYPERQYVENGGLLSYGPSLVEAYHQIGVYTGKILRGTKPADLPVVQPTKFELVINLKTAKALGITVPQTLLVAADDVIE